MTQFLRADSYIPPYMAYPRFLLELGISENAKLVYMLLLDRARLSMKNRDWQDASGRVFVLYTIPNLARDIGKGETTDKKALNQLVQQGGNISQYFVFSTVYLTGSGSDNCGGFCFCRIL